jgi:hypothetical protein
MEGRVHPEWLDRGTASKQVGHRITSSAHRVSQRRFLLALCVGAWWHVGPYLGCSHIGPPDWVARSTRWGNAGKRVRRREFRHSIPLRFRVEQRCSRIRLRQGVQRLNCGGHGQCRSVNVRSRSRRSRSRGCVSKRCLAVGLSQHRIPGHVTGFCIRRSSRIAPIGQSAAGRGTSFVSNVRPLPRLSGFRARLRLRKCHPTRFEPWITRSLSVMVFRQPDKA